VQALASVANKLCQARFDVQVHIFQVKLPFKRAGVDLLNNLPHAALNVGEILGADDALCGEHAGVGQ